MGGILHVVREIGLQQIEVLDLGAATGLSHRCLEVPLDDARPLLPNLWSLCLSFCTDLCLSSLQALLAACPSLQCLYLDHTHPSLLLPCTRAYRERSVTVSSPLISIASLCPRLSVLDISNTSGSKQQGGRGAEKQHRDDMQGGEQGRSGGGGQGSLEGLQEVLQAQVMIRPSIMNSTTEFADLFGSGECAYLYLQLLAMSPF